MWTDELAKEAEKAAQTGNMKCVYDVTKKLCKYQSKNLGVVKSKDGTILSKESDIRERWKEHFNELLNRPEPEHPADGLDDNNDVLDIETDPPSIKDEIRNAIRDMKSGKAPGVDNITAELLKADIETSVDKIHNLVREIWREERSPEDWNRGLIVKLPKKGGLAQCGNWRGITLLVTTAKIMGKIIISRITKELDNQLREEQPGVRKGRGTTEQIYILRGTSLNKQQSGDQIFIYCSLTIYEKAFDSVHRETLWKILKHYGIPEKLINMVNVMYNNNQCAVLDGEGTSDFFTVKSGVKQGCNMAGFLFIIVIDIDWIMNVTTKKS